MQYYLLIILSLRVNFTMKIQHYIIYLATTTVQYVLVRSTFYVCLNICDSFVIPYIELFLFCAKMFWFQRTDRKSLNKNLNITGNFGCKIFDSVRGRFVLITLKVFNLILFLHNIISHFATLNNKSVYRRTLQCYCTNLLLKLLNHAITSSKHFLYDVKSWHMTKLSEIIFVCDNDK